LHRLKPSRISKLLNVFLNIHVKCEDLNVESIQTSHITSINRKHDKRFFTKPQLI